MPSPFIFFIIFGPKHNQCINRLRPLPLRQYDKRVDFNLEDAGGALYGIFGQAHHSRHQRLNVGARAAAKAPQQAPSQSTVNQRKGSIRRAGTLHECDVAHQLNRGAAQTEHQHRTELRIDPHTNDGFDATFKHRLQRKALKLQVRVACTHCRSRGRHCGAVAQTQLHQPGLHLVRDTARDALEDQRKLQSRRSRSRSQFILRGDKHRRQYRESGALQFGLCFSLIEQPRRGRLRHHRLRQNCSRGSHRVDRCGA